ncbi:hypothetical protein TWF106_011384 [Orbilia oligospora]|uniref:Uncharacterized protein n=1 Tax=Orbilia oligospora TaxID=2813651 RepID=A0A6G1M172_ORBOL|nr:hypothetical protein TWF191_003184 [Orbilia oligospora]KAF3208702.1 hypothetical protein TWF106_011384 [Orbilia oligospora]KAF3223836.1 hypothetical protein TWF679_000271 [Orbilia oligospora]KAF3241605.1 hypothetical protein TWF192_008899 [Orbilia oligospora]
MKREVPSANHQSSLENATAEVPDNRSEAVGLFYPEYDNPYEQPVFKYGGGGGGIDVKREDITNIRSQREFTPPSDSEPSTTEKIPVQFQNITHDKVPEDYLDTKSITREPFPKQFYKLQYSAILQNLQTILKNETTDIIKITSTLIYKITKYSIIFFLALLIGGIIPLHLIALIFPDSTCGLFDPYTPDSLAILSPCSTSTWPIIPEPDPFFARAVSQSSSFGDLQRISSKSDSLPSKITGTRHEFRKILMELTVGTADVSSMTNLYSLIPEYNHLLDAVIDGMYDCSSKTRSLIDDAITYTSWTNAALRRIDSKNSSALTSLIYYRRWWPYEKSWAEMELERAFDEYAIKMEDLAGSVYDRYVELGRHLVEFGGKLDSIASALNVGHDTFQKTKAAEKSHWKKLIGSQPYKQKMEDLDKKSELFAAVYRSSMEGLQIVDATKLALSQTRTGIRHLREEVGKATLPRGKEWSLKLTMRLLENSVAELRASKAYRVGYP